MTSFFTNLQQFYKDLNISNHFSDPQTALATQEFSLAFGTENFCLPQPNHDKPFTSRFTEQDATFLEKNHGNWKYITSIPDDASLTKDELQTLHLSHKSSPYVSKLIENSIILEENKKSTMILTDMRSIGKENIAYGILNKHYCNRCLRS
jgi:hypothetical protein